MSGLFLSRFAKFINPALLVSLYYRNRKHDVKIIEEKLGPSDFLFGNTSVCYLSVGYLTEILIMLPSACSI